jgi:hypothetical protein
MTMLHLLFMTEFFRLWLQYDRSLFYAMSSHIKQSESSLKCYSMRKMRDVCTASNLITKNLEVPCDNCTLKLWMMLPRNNGCAIVCIISTPTIKNTFNRTQGHTILVNLHHHHPVQVINHLTLLSDSKSSISARASPPDSLYFLASNMAL